AVGQRHRVRGEHAALGRVCAVRGGGPRLLRCRLDVVHSPSSLWWWGRGQSIVRQGWASGWFHSHWSTCAAYDGSSGATHRPHHARWASPRGSISSSPYPRVRGTASATTVRFQLACTCWWSRSRSWMWTPT